MILARSKIMLGFLIHFQLVEAILERRKVIRYVRDQQGDDRCFLDYYLIWEFIISSPRMPRFTAEEGMKRCNLFFEHCRAETPDTIPFNTMCEIKRWDANLRLLSHAELVEELFAVQEAIVRHRDVETDEQRPRTCDDDRALFLATLPELTPCDFRLPAREKFLISTTPTSGCPAFWQSHVGCDNYCNLHQWGACRSF
jgi:hypothetical protein